MDPEKKKTRVLVLKWSSMTWMIWEIWGTPMT